MSRLRRGSRLDPRIAGLEDALRRDLHRAADSVEPAADGLDRIRTKIVAGRQARQARWSQATAAARGLAPARVRLRRLVRDVCDRFGPDPGRTGWLGWLRPVAAAATGLSVLGAATWAVAALPQVVSPAGNAAKITRPGLTANATLANPSASAGSGSTTGQPRSSGVGGPTPSASCAPSGPPGASPPRSPSDSPGPSGSGSPGPSGTPSPSPSSSSLSGRGLRAAPRRAFATGGPPSPSASPSASPPASPSTSPPRSPPALRSASPCARP